MIGVVAGMVIIAVVCNAMDHIVFGAISARSPVGIGEDGERYIAIRNQPFFLLARVGYTFVAAFLAGWTTSKISLYGRKQAVLLLTLLQLGLILWTGFISESKSTAPAQLWIALCFAVALGINAGYRKSLRSGN